MPTNLVKVAGQVRLKLARTIESEYMVTWADVFKETKRVLQDRAALTNKVKMPSEGWFARNVRANTKVGARPSDGSRKKRITRLVVLLSRKGGWRAATTRGVGAEPPEEPTKRKFRSMLCPCGLKWCTLWPPPPAMWPSSHCKPCP